MSGEEIVHLFLHSTLTLRVKGQQIASEGQCVAAGFVASQEEHERLTHDLVFCYHLFLWTPGGCLLWVKTVILIGVWRLRLLVPVFRLISMVRCVKVLHRHRLTAAPCIQHQLKEISTPLHTETYIRNELHKYIHAGNCEWSIEIFQWSITDLTHIFRLYCVWDD